MRSSASVSGAAERLCSPPLEPPPSFRAAIVPLFLLGIEDEHSGRINSCTGRALANGHELIRADQVEASINGLCRGEITEDARYEADRPEARDRIHEVEGSLPYQVLQLAICSDAQKCIGEIHFCRISPDPVESDR